MQVLVVGASGMLWRKVTEELVRTGAIGPEAVDEVVVSDIADPGPVFDSRVTVSYVHADLSAPGDAARLVSSRPQFIFHIAAVVSGEAEADLPKGYRINLDGSRACWRPSGSRTSATRTDRGSSSVRPSPFSGRPA